MTLTQAISKASVIWIFNGEMALRINKRQARDLRRQSTWIENGHPDDYGDAPSWGLDGDRLNLHWPQ